MATVHRAIFIWFWLLIFIILLVLRLDEKVEWNWFVIFLPMWVLDCTFLGASIVRFTQTMKTRPRSAGSSNNSNVAALEAYRLKLRRSFAAATVAVLAMTFQVLLCVRLQYMESGYSLSLYYVFTPFWILLIVALVDLSYRLVVIYRQ